MLQAGDTGVLNWLADTISLNTLNSFLSVFKVPAGKGVKLTFKKFQVSEPGQEDGKNCRKDYVEVNGKKSVHCTSVLKTHAHTHTHHKRADMSLHVSLILRICGEQPDNKVTVTSNTNKMEVTFFSDKSYVDRGFEAAYEAIDVRDRESFTALNN